MSIATVNVSNTSISFHCASAESILHAGLAAGVNLEYGCEGGNCGDCKARLISGELIKLSHSDYQFSLYEKAQNYFLTCRNAAKNDVVISANLREVINELPQQRIETKVYQLNSLSGSVLSVALRTPRSQPLSFYAGQFYKVTFENGSSQYKSISSCPCDGLKPAIQIQRNKHYAFNSYAFRGLKKGEKVNIIGPFGQFTVEDGLSVPRIFITFDTGFSSVNSLVEQLINIEYTGDIKIIWCLSKSCDGYLDNYCRAISDAFDNFSYSILENLDRSAKSHHRIDHHLISIFNTSDLKSQFDQTIFYLALPDEAFRNQWH